MSSLSMQPAAGPFQLRFLFAGYPKLLGKTLGLVYRTITTWLIHHAGIAVLNRYWP